MTPLRLLAVATHPIQYQAPWYRALSVRPEVELEVFFEHLPDARAQGGGFDVPFHWDTPLLDGYDWHCGLPPGARRARGVALAALVRRIAAFRPQVVLITGWQSMVLAAAPLLARRAGARVLVRGESNLLKPRPRWLHAAHRRWLRRYDAVLAIGQHNRDWYRAHGVAPERIVDCPYCVDNETFAARADAAAPRRRALRRGFGVPEDAVCFLFAGKLEAKKRVLDAVDAIEHAPADAHLLIVGSGAEEASLRARARGRAVSFAGFLNQGAMADAYQCADCLVLPSDHGETWGLVVNEAMACGRAAVISDLVGCAPDLVVAGETGWVYPARDVPALTAALAHAASDRGRLAAMGRAARTRVHARHGVAAAAQAVVRAAIAVTARGADACGAAG